MRDGEPFALLSRTHSWRSAISRSTFVARCAGGQTGIILLPSQSLNFFDKFFLIRESEPTIYSVFDLNVQVESTTGGTGITGKSKTKHPCDPRDPSGLLFLNTQVKNALESCHRHPQMLRPECPEFERMFGQDFNREIAAQFAFVNKTLPRERCFFPMTWGRNKLLKHSRVYTLLNF